MVAYDTGCIRAMGLIYRDVSWGRPTGCDTGWIGAMELFHGDTRHWLERGNGFDLWRCIAMGHTTLAGSVWWDWFMGVCRGACNTGWIGAIELIYGIRNGGTRLDWGDGIDLRGHAIGIWHWLGHVMGTRLDQRDGIDLWGHATGVRHWLDVNYEIDLWGYSMGRATGSGRWNWFVGANHVWHWL